MDVLREQLQGLARLEPPDRSLDEAVDWAKRMPVFDGPDSEVEIRQIAEMEDFGDSVTPELKAQEERRRKELEGRH